MKKIDNLILAIKNKTLTEDIFESCFYDLFSFDQKLPKMVSAKEYAKTKGVIIYRGFNCDKLSFCKYVYDFAKGEFQRTHKSAALGNGIYFATKKYYANYYTRLSKLNSFFGVNILSGKLSTDIKLTSPKLINHEFFRDKSKVKKILNQKFDGALNSGDLEYLYWFMLGGSDYMTKSVTLGYDALIRPSVKNHGFVVVVYNRDKVILNEKISKLFDPSFEK